MWKRALLLSHLVIACSRFVSAGDLFFPQFVQGSSSSGTYVTEITLFNPSNRPGSGNLHFRDSAGRPMSISFQDGSSGSVIPYTLQGGGSLVLRSTGPGPLKVGWLKVDAAATLTGRLTLILYDHLGTPKSSVSVPASPISQSFVVPVDYSAVSNTAVAIANPVGWLSPISLGPPISSFVYVGLILLDQSGRVVGSTKIDGLEAYSHAARFVHELFNGITNPFRGTLIVATGGTDDDGILLLPLPGEPHPADRAILLGLQFNEGLFSSISPETVFHLPYASTRIQEAAVDNNSVSTAQVIDTFPLTLEGTVSTPGDRDYFRVRLNKAELLVGLLEVVSGPTPTFAPELVVHDVRGSGLERFRPGEPIVFRAFESGIYYLNIGDGGDDYGASLAAYRVTFMRIP